MWQAKSFTRFKAKKAIASTYIREPKIMGDFFQGWRRKTGCVTLVFALSVAALWVRSLTTSDHVDYSSSFYLYRWISCNGVFYHSKWELGQYLLPRDLKGQIRWQQAHVTADADDAIITAARPEETWGVYSQHEHTPFYNIESYIRYSSIVIPLTVLSGVLLLSKPRKPRPIESPNGTGGCQPRPSAWVRDISI